MSTNPRGDGPRVVIVGGGFAGLYAAKALARAAVRVMVIDRRNHHLFQPLLYQVATAALSPAQIAAPIRKVLSKQRNAEVLLAEVEGVDTARRVVLLGPAAGVESGDREVPYDYLIIATGASHSYFGNEAWAPFAPGLKTIEDAVDIRRRILMAFERAERERDEAERKRELTFIVIGAGPTGVEMAGALAEIAVKSIPRDFRRIDTSSARIVLVEAQDRVLPAGFPPELSARARDSLVRLGVEVRLGQRVMAVDAEGVQLRRQDGSTERLGARNVIWAAGVKASSLIASLGTPMDRAGRAEVGPDLAVPGHPEVFVLGDAARVVDARTGQEVPGMCPPAIQMGVYAGGIIAGETRGPRPDPSSRRPFRYRDKGLLATIGRNKAVAFVSGFRFSGYPAWALWALVHIFYLIGFRNRVLVMIEWAWAYLVFERGARLITGEMAAASTGDRPVA
ncbi:MAG: NAD(P)/FAD-dependent oxidoreductase [Phycisphaerales bacterium]|nr:NAD(P)/FAD-dependent oxidoreductase [Phycisphaerales bacterium]